MAKTFETIISVLDKASVPVLALEERLSKLGKVGKAAQHSIKMRPHQKLWSEFSESVHRAREGIGELGDKVGEFGERLGEILPMLGAFGSAGSIAGLFEIAHAASEAAEQLRNVSLIAGSTVPQMQALEYSAQQTGVPVQTLTDGLARLNQHLGNAAAGLDKRSASIFHAAGINLRDANGHVRTAVQVFPQLVSALTNTHNASILTSVAMQLLGRSGKDLLPLLTMGVPKLQGLNKEFQNIGYNLGKEQQEKLEKFQHSWINLTTAVDGFKNAIGVAIGPVFAPLIAQFAKFLALNRAWIAADIASAVKYLGEKLSELHIQKIIESCKSWAKVTGEVIDKLGGLKMVLIATGTIMGVTFLAPMIRVTAQLATMAAAMGAPMLGAVGALGMNLLRIIPTIRSLRDVWAAMNLVMEANPLGVAITLAAALGASAWYLYNNWDTVSKKLASIFKWIGDKFNLVFGPMSAAIDRVTAGFEHLIGGPAPAKHQASDSPSPWRNRMIHTWMPATPDATSHLPDFHPNTPRGRPGAAGASGRIDAHIHVDVTNSNAPQVRAGASSSGGVNAPLINIRTGTNSMMDMH